MGAPKRFAAGRRKDSDKRPKNRIISFSADDETTQALEELESELGAGVINGRRSAVVRQAIHEARNRLRATKAEGSD